MNKKVENEMNETERFILPHNWYNISPSLNTAAVVLGQGETIILFILRKKYHFIQLYKLTLFIPRLLQTLVRL